MKKCRCWRCEDYKTCDINKMSEEEVKKLPCIKYQLDKDCTLEDIIKEQFVEGKDEQKAD